MRFMPVLLLSAWACGTPAFAQRVQIDESTEQQALLHHRLGWQALASEDWEGARDHFTKATDLDTRFASAFYGLGKSNMALKQFRPAIAAYSRARDIYQEDAGDAYGDQMTANQNIQSRIRELREAIREQTNTPGRQAAAAAGNNRVVRELEEQIRQLDMMLRSGRSATPELAVPAEIYLALGSAYFRNGNTAEAEREYRTAVRIRPGFGEAWNNLAVVCLTTGRPVEAQEAVKKAKKSGFKVNPALEDDIKAAKAKTD
jgi:tetratricopeptide (TPR) repeat protein